MAFTARRQALEVSAVVEVIPDGSRHGFERCRLLILPALRRNAGTSKSSSAMLKLMSAASRLGMLRENMTRDSRL